jgi:hypothetical protein
VIVLRALTLPHTMTNISIVVAKFYGTGRSYNAIVWLTKGNVNKDPNIDIFISEMSKFI